MQVLNKQVSKTQAKYSVSASDEELNNYREVVASRLTDSVKVPGFRPGKAPTDMILKHADQSTLQNEFLNLAVNDLYIQSQKEIEVRIIGDPKISISKFVPYSTLELSVEVPIIKDIKLPNYKNLKLTKSKPKLPNDVIDRNILELQKRAATLKAVKRPAKLGDLVITDFEATDPKTKKAIPPATAKNYRVLLGEGSLIPGFEEKLVGLSAGKSKSFDLTFPKDYVDKAFSGRKVHFKATLTEINEVDLPKVDDQFAKSVGPFNNPEELKSALKQQLEAESERQATIDYGNRLLDKIAETTEVEISNDLIESEQEFLLNNAKKSALERGLTWKEFLASLGQSEDHYLKELSKAATLRLKGGLAIGEIASLEGLTVSDDELNNEISNLKNRYTDPEMQQQLDDPNNKRELKMRMLTEKVLNFIQDNQVRAA